jgi:hypothetical protein
MKILAIILFLLAPITASAQNQPSMNQGDMQTIMQQMQKMQKCMARIDQDQLNKLQELSEQANKDIEALCADGKRSKAQKKAITFAKEMASSPALKQMQKCGEMMQGTMPGMPMPGMPDTFDQKDYSSSHVCDE